MGSRNTLTIGVTVNLDHYENLRLEVSGEVGSAEEARELSRFLDSTLAQFGRGDPATAERVDSYRKRVFPGVPEKIGPGMRDTGGMPPPPPEHHREPMASSPGPMNAADSTPVYLKASQTGIAPADEAVQETRVIAQEPVPVSAAPRGGNTAHSAGDGGVTAPECESCHAAVTTAEEKMSRLFTGRTLCRACMKNL